MFHNIPIIGVIGGIGSGKSYVSNLFGEEGCLVIDSDMQAKLAYNDPKVRATLRDWWGPEIIPFEGSINRKTIAKIIFTNDAERLRLESVIHPWVAQKRDEEMHNSLATKPLPLAFIWDTPLLCETGLYKECDRVVFVDAPLSERLERVKSRGWDETELERRENLQWPLDKKRSVAHDVIRNSTDAGDTRVQVRNVLTRILASS